MLLELGDLIGQYKLRITGILHVGAHLAEEADLYRENGIKLVYWVEGNPDNISRIETKVFRDNHWVINALVTDKNGEPTEFNITNYDSMSSSVFPFGTHTQFSPDTKFIDKRVYESRTLDSLWAEYQYFPQVNLLNMDLQGAELLALKGGTELLKQIDYIYTEVNDREVYLGGALIEQLDAYLEGFVRVETGWVANQGWGDALYIRRDQ